MIISRAEKHSPHSSPRLSRRSTTPNVISSAAAVPTPSSVVAPSEIYAAQQAILPTAPSMHSINGSNQPTNCNVMKPTSKQPTANQSATQSNSNRMSAPPMSSSSTQVINKVLNKALSADLNDIHANDQIAPPLPPRKSSPNVDSSVNRMLKPHSINNVTSASSLVNLSTNSTISSSLSRSSENITFCEFDVPNSIAPPIPKHNVPRPVVQTVASDLQVLSTTDDDLDKVIVGPAETITGLIDTRPLDARKPIIIMSTDKEQSTNNESNNLYHMKTNSNQQNHQRNQSVPNSHTTLSSNTTSITTTTTATITPMVNAIASRPISTKSITSSQVCPETSSSSGSGIMPSAITNADAQPLLYENVTINHKDCNVPYENINLEYIARLMNEGYSKESVVTALGISRNNIEMACDILHEFVSKNSA